MMRKSSLLLGSTLSWGQAIKFVIFKLELKLSNSKLSFKQFKKSFKKTQSINNKNLKKIDFKLF